MIEFCEERKEMDMLLVPSGEKAWQTTPRGCSLLTSRTFFWSIRVNEERFEVL